MISRSALIVDDERDIRELVALTLGRMGLRVETAGDLAQARAQLQTHDFDFCLTDMRLPDGNGTQLVEHIAARHPNTPVAMMTAYGNVEAAVAALKAGAFDFVTKPVDLAVLRQLVTHALNLGVQRRAAAQAHTPRLIGDSPAMRQLRETAVKVARSQAPVFICGESGTGKELVARLVHAQSPRKDGPFVPVNCGAIPAELMESELFGHRKGSFTGAHADKDGLFQAAQGGTLFLDEIAELPLHMQVKLLRVIQEKAVRPVGAPSEVPVDVRILSATHKDLAKLVDDGRFRHDLFYRINVIALPVPPLRERREDIPAIAEAVLARIAREQGLALDLADDARAALAAYPFPGNVRELENVLERAVALADGPSLRATDLGLPATGAHGDAVVVPTGRTLPPDTDTPEPPDAPLPATVEALARARADGALPETLAQIEREALIAALDAHRWHRTKTAEALGITFRALRYKLKKYGIE
ncbi:sigma-54 dependent transcriptional regulator [Silanimonas sp.]|jgi:two-component system response regulator PilR (NtrC family)|uniref:sigma-54-dependent transcriptional regulator n=1 Tax=Silanimonas sp. TaxID=1929290 RepID=UPI0022BECB7D|nr:sigma-54 dependent transcriptional regulator [Silanimonas sp.]MCZ8062377.1 sigma-54 dependent transcriptional regulator [Silanimonas sp.]